MKFCLSVEGKCSPVDFVWHILDLNTSPRSFSFSRQVSLSSLAILRNVAFYPNGRVKVLLDKNVLSTLARLVDLTETEPEMSNIVLSLIWALAHNNHRAKVVLQQSGVTKRVREEVHRREMKRRSSVGARRGDDLLDTVKNILVVEKLPKA